MVSGEIDFPVSSATGVVLTPPEMRVLVAMSGGSSLVASWVVDGATEALTEEASADGVQSLVARGLATFGEGSLTIAPHVAGVGVAVGRAEICVMLVWESPAAVTAGRIVEGAGFRAYLSPRPPGLVEAFLIDPDTPLADVLADLTTDFDGSGLLSLTVVAELGRVDGDYALRLDRGASTVTKYELVTPSAREVGDWSEVAAGEVAATLCAAFAA